MPEPTSASIVTYISATKLWSIVSGVCGSFIPILALTDKTKISLKNAFFMAVTGSSFSIFVGPWVAEKINLLSLQGIIALSWVMGATGVYLVRAVFNWLDKKGVDAIDKIMNRFIGTASESPKTTTPPETKNDSSK